MTFKKTCACFIFILLNHFAYSQQIKKIITGSIDGTDTTVFSVKEYSPEGYLLSEDEPEIYCGKTYTYDELGRYKTTEQYCGESASNGYTNYEYYTNKTCTRESAAGYTHIICDSFALDQTRILTTNTFIDQMDYTLEEKVTAIQTRYFHQKKVLIKKAETKIEYNTDSTQTDTTFLITTYAYNALDSLTGYLTVDQKTKDTLDKLVVTYDPLTNLKTKEVRNITSDTYPFNHENHITTYTYDKEERLIKHQYLEFSLYDSKPHAEHTFEYIFKKDQLFQKTEITRNNYESWKHVGLYKNNLLIKQSLYIEGMTVIAEHYYKENLLIKTTNYAKGKVIAETNYYYTYW